MSNNGSRVVGMVLTLALTGMALAFLVGMAETARAVHDPTPVFGMVIAGVIFGVLLRGPVGKAIAKMLEGSGAHDDQMGARVDQLEDRLAELGLDGIRVAELEERLDFAERLLAQRDSQQLPSNVERR